MAIVSKEEGTINANDLTTVPRSVRQALGVEDGGRVSFVVDNQRRGHLETVGVSEAEDPIVESLLQFLSQDMATYADRAILAFPPSLRDRISVLVEGMTFDPDAEFEGKVAL